MDSEEPPNVRVACSGDIDEVVRLMHDAAAWMSAKGNARLGRRADRPDIRGDLRPEIRAPSRELQRRHRRLLHLVGRGSRVLARRPQGRPHICNARGATDTCGPGCQLRADRGLPPCRANAGAPLRLDCHPNLRGLYERLGFTHVDTFNPGWDPTFIAERLELEI